MFCGKTVEKHAVFYKHLHKNLLVQLSMKEVSCSSSGNFKEVHVIKAGIKLLYFGQTCYVVIWVYTSLFPKNSRGTGDCSFPRACSPRILVELEIAVFHVRSRNASGTADCSFRRACLLARRTQSLFLIVSP